MLVAEGENMKLTIKLNNEQALRAANVVAQVFARDGEYEKTDFNWSGNLLGNNQRQLYNHNPNQNLDYLSDTKVISFDGWRHPFVHDGGLAVLKTILGKDWRNAPVVDYQTSEKFMRWYETSLEYLERLSPVDRLIYAVRLSRRLQCNLNDWIPVSQSELINPIDLSGCNRFVDGRLPLSQVLRLTKLGKLLLDAAQAEGKILSKAGEINQFERRAQLEELGIPMRTIMDLSELLNLDKYLLDW